jgi:hypothetical protein
MNLLMNLIKKFNKKIAEVKEVLNFMEAYDEYERSKM